MAGGKIKQLLGAAEAAEKVGDTARAAAIYREILSAMPKHSRARKALAKLEKQGGGKPRMGQGEANQLLGLLNTGNFAAVVQAADTLMQQFRDEPFVFNVKGYAQTQMGQTTDAVKSYRWAIKLDPTFVEPFGNLGALYVQMGRFEEAEDVLRKAIAKKEAWPEAHHNLGVALAAREDEANALAHYDRAIALRPEYGNAYNSRGSLHRLAGRTRAAIDDFTKAAQLIPNDPDILANLASVQADAGQVQDGLDTISKALTLAPKSEPILLKRAIFLNEAGRRDEAASAFDDLLAVVPDHAVGLRLSYELVGGDAQGARIATMRELAAKPDLPPEDRVHLNFALGLHFDRMKDTARASDHLSTANGTYRKLLQRPPETDDEKFARICKTFEDEALDHLEPYGSDDERPVFIVGMMRSGTTLVEQIISSHSAAYGAGELMSATLLSGPLYAAGRKATETQMRDFQQAYLAELSAHAGDARRIVDKMPGNFFNVGLLRLAFPKARIINTVRDPRDTCFSIWKNYFDTHAHQYAYDQRELASFANNYKRMMDFWDAHLPEGSIYHIRYEDLVADQEAESRKLIQHLGLSWEDSVLEFHKTKRAVRTASINQVRQKIYRSSLAAWEPYSDHLAPLLDGLDMDLWKDALAD